MYSSHNKPLALFRLPKCVGPMLALLLAFHPGAAAAQQPETMPSSVVQAGTSAAKSSMRAVANPLPAV